MSNKIQNVLAITLLIGVVGATFFFAYQKQFYTAKESPVVKESTRTPQKEITIESTVNGEKRVAKKFVNPDNTHYEHSTDPDIIAKYYTEDERLSIRETLFTLTEYYEGSTIKEPKYEWDSFLNMKDYDASYLLACLDKNHKLSKKDIASYEYWDALYTLDTRTDFCDYEIARLIVRLNEKLCETSGAKLSTNMDIIRNLSFISRDMGSSKMSRSEFFEKVYKVAEKYLCSGVDITEL